MNRALSYVVELLSVSPDSHLISVACPLQEILRRYASHYFYVIIIDKSYITIPSIKTV